MICTACGVSTPPLQTKVCPFCGGGLRLSAEDILGHKETRIVTELRPPQVDLAKTVEDAIAQNKNAITEAGTGTGKSLGLLVPPILAGKRVLISTATTLLQHQYMTKDLPFLLAHLAPMGHEFRFAVAKGRSHYLCKKRLKEYSKKHEVPESLLEWAKTSATGDKLELGQDVPPYWPEINGDDCAGASKCSVKDCGLVAARDLLAKANVVVANHALVGFNIRLGQLLLPKYDFYIIDEAHKAAEYFRKAFSESLNEHAIPKMIKYLEESGSLPPGDEYDVTTKQLREKNKELFGMFSTRRDGGFESLKPEKLVNELDTLAKLVLILLDPIAAESKARDLGKRAKDAVSSAYLAKIESLMTSVDAKRDLSLKALPADVIAVAAQKVQRVFSSITAIRDCDQDKDLDIDTRILYVQYPRTKRGGREIVYEPVFIDKTLRTKLFPVSKVVAASATLTINNSFNHFAEEMGFDKDSLEYVTASPFDYAHRALLYCSENVPIHPARNKVPQHEMEKKLDEYYEAMAQEIDDLTAMSQGHAFVLFTSRVEMDEVSKRLSEKSSFPVRTQEEGAAAGALETWFRQTENPILCGLKSFWEGVSVEGDRLRLVVITKAPFPQQGDPVYQAKKDILEKKLGSWNARFNALDIPAMITDVKQGTGRLIRTRMDYGVAAILDRKVTGQATRRGSYASLLLNSLPFTLRTTKLKDVSMFLKHFEE